LRSKKERAKEEERKKKGEREVEFPKQHNSLRSTTSCLCSWYPTRTREEKVIFKIIIECKF
jgi:hypothetical protein